MNTNKKKKDDLDNSITQVSQAYDNSHLPSIELNNLLKAKLREKEAIILAAENKKHISLWYVPMILNSLVFTLMALMAQVLIQNNIALQIVTGICAYIVIAGIFLTAVGMKLSTLKTVLTIELNKGGTLI